MKQPGLAIRDPLSLVAHPIAEVFPMMTGAEIAGLAADIAVNGLNTPIVLWEADMSIVDGRNRLAACRLAAIEPRFELFRGDDPLPFIISSNLKRRHLTETQRAMVAVKIATMQRGRPDKNTAIAGVSQTEAARLLNVSPDSVGRAAAVRRAGVPGLVEAVEGGDIAVSLAANTLRRMRQRGEEPSSLAAVKAAMKETWRDMNPATPVKATAPIAEDRAETERQRGVHNRAVIGTDTTGAVRAVVRHAELHPVATLVPMLDRWTRRLLLNDLPAAIEYLGELRTALEGKANAVDH